MATRSLSKPPAPAPKKPTRAQFESWLQLDEERKRLNREAAAVSKQQDGVGEAIMAYAIDAGGKERTVTCCGHRASVLSERKSPYWLGEFTKLAGQAKVEELREQQPMRDKLFVETA